MDFPERTTPDECCFVPTTLQSSGQAPADTSFEEFCLSLTPLPSSSLDLSNPLEFDRPLSPIQARTIQKIDFSTISSDCTVGLPSTSLSITVSDSDNHWPVKEAMQSIVLKPLPGRRPHLKKTRCGSQHKYMFLKTPAQTVTS